MKQNHHTHTTRCGHAVGTEREYIEAALSSGHTELGFSDHSPWPGLHSPRIRMDESQLPDYVNTLTSLKEEYQDRIRLRIGLECEYFPKDLSWLRRQKEEFGLEYLILGNHFDLCERTGMYFGTCSRPEEVKRYLLTTLEAMETGLYDLLAHPDLFLKSYQHFDAACKEAAIEISRAAKALDIPLEYNLLGLRMMQERGVPGLGYPYHAFWEVVAQEGCHVIVNADAHDPAQLSDTTYYDQAMKNLKELGIHPIKGLFSKNTQAA